MPAALPYDRFSAQGNVFCVLDFQYIDTPVPRQTIQRWANVAQTRFFDQLLIIDASADHDNPYPVVIYNADGSTAEQCGNGMRAPAFWLHRRGHTRATVLHPPAGAVEIAKLQPSTQSNRAWVKVRLPGPCVESEHALWPDTPALGAARVSLGNPHLVLRWPHPPTGDECLQVGGHAQQDPHFPDGVNVGLAHVRGDDVQLRVYERGVGPTDACGSGACAAAFALAAMGVRQPPITVGQPGGKLMVDWSGDVHAARVVELAGDVDWIEQGQFQA